MLTARPVMEPSYFSNPQRVFPRKTTKGSEKFIAPPQKPKNTVCTSISLSKIKSSEFLLRGNVSNTSRVNARKPVWYSESLTPSTIFSMSVRNLFAIYLYKGIPTFKAVPPSILEPSTTVHPDYQYSPRLVTAMASMIASGHYQFATFNLYQNSSILFLYRHDKGILTNKLL